MADAAEPSPSTRPLPVVSYLKIPEQGEPHLEGIRCRKCGAIFLGERIACSKCSARGELDPVRLSDTGRLHVYSIVHRSFPGVEVPYVSAVVDLDGGGTLKGNLVNIEPDPQKIRMGMPVEVIYQVAPRKDQEGNEYLTYCFQPRSE